MPDRLTQAALDRVAVEDLGVMAGADLAGHQVLHGPLVDQLVGEADRESVPGAVQVMSVVMFADQAGDQRGIEAATQIETDIHVGLQTAGNGGAQPVFQILVIRLSRRVQILCQRIVEIPVRRNGEPAFFQREQMSRRQAAHVGEQAVRADRAGEGQHLIQPGHVDPAADHRVFQQRLDLGGEQQHAVAIDIEKRRDARLVPSQQKPVPCPVMECEGELAVQPFHEGGAVFLVKMDQHLHVDLRPEAVPPADEIVAQLPVIVDLPVTDESDCIVFIADRLVPAIQIYDRKTAKPERQTGSAGECLLVRPPVRQCVGHAPQQGHVERGGRIRVMASDETAHG